jgi:endo-1,4-beta-xylanase
VIVNVQDQDGNPVPGAQIKIDKTRQGFPLGLPINYQLPDNPRYQEYVKQRFNWAVFENEAKWYFNENQPGVYNYE